MNFRLTRRAARDYEELPEPLRRQMDKQITFLLSNIRHPSLDAKQYDPARGSGKDVSIGAIASISRSSRTRIPCSPSPSTRSRTPLRPAIDASPHRASNALAISAEPVWVA
jgi:hypothetical protein